MLCFKVSSKYFVVEKGDVKFFMNLDSEGFHAEKDGKVLRPVEVRSEIVDLKNLIDELKKIWSDEVVLLKFKEGAQQFGL